MGKKKKTPLELGKRERQIYETIVALEEASVSNVLERLADAPSYSAVRATMNLLTDKKWLKRRKVGSKFLYSPAAGKEKARRNAIRGLLSTVFSGSATDAVAALLDVSSSKLTDDQLNEMIQMIQDAKEENQS